MANEVAVVNQQERALLMGVLGGRLAQDIEFTQLDNAIEKIASNTEKLSDGERESAASLIEKFESRVVDSISRKNNTLSNFYSVLKYTPNVSYGSIEFVVEHYSDQMHLLFANQKLADLDEMFKKVENGVNSIHTREAEEKPMSPFIDEEVMSPMDVTQAKMAHELEMAKFNNVIKKDQYHVRRDFFDFMKAMAGNTEIKKFCKILDAQQKAAEEAKNIVAEKAEAAKMAILIGDADIRAALQEFHEFASTAV